MKYQAAPPPSRLEDVIEWLAREHRRLASHTHEELHWDHVPAPASAMQAPASAGAAWDDTSLGWLFDGAAAEQVHIVVQLPHDWAQTDLRPHVHWEKSTSATGGVAWQMAYQWSPVGGARTTEATLVAADVVEYTAGADWQMLTDLGTITASAATGISDTLIVRLSRQPGATSDTYATDARLVGFTLRYQRDRGSTYLYEKG